VRLFEPSETTTDLDALLREGGHDPANALVYDIKAIISRYYAKRTAEVLKRVNEVLANYIAANEAQSWNSQSADRTTPPPFRPLCSALDRCRKK